MSDLDHLLASLRAERDKIDAEIACAEHAIALMEIYPPPRTAPNKSAPAPRQETVLGAVGAEPMAIREIASRVGVSNHIVQLAIGKLRAKGLVERVAHGTYRRAAGNGT